jgi:hypothetical protein
MPRAPLSGWLDGRWCIALIALEVLTALVLLVPRAEVASAGAGLGEYAASLAAGRGYVMDVPCGQIDHVRRMPLAPIFLAGVSLLGGGLWAAVVARLGLLLTLLVWLVARFARAHGPSWWRSPAWVGLFAVLAASPVFAKHLAQTGYEEGFSLLLIPCLLLAGLGTLDTSPGADARRAFWCIALGALLGAVFLVKSGYVPLHGVGCVALVWAGLRHRQRSAWIGLMVALAAPLAWGAFVLRASGRLSLGTSWDGENLFRGWCDAGYRIYPWQSLDRLFDTAWITTPGGAVPAPPTPPRCAFPSEWAWSDHYRDRALAWATRTPASGALFAMQKALVVSFEVRPVPGVGASDPSRLLVVVLSFLVLRGASLVALVIGWRRRAALARATPSLLFALGASLALCAPLIIGFAYDRHSVVVIVAVLFLATGILARATHEESSGAVSWSFARPRAESAPPTSGKSN